MARIYISSTFSDLEGCRKAVYDALRAMGHDVIAMEHYVATDQRPLDKCLDDVGRCDLYVGLFAWRYGYMPDKDNPEQKSITELEFRHAAANGVTPLIFLLDENAPWPPSQMEKGKGATRLKRLRAELAREYTVSFFKDCAQLATQASLAVTNAVARKAAATAVSPPSVTPQPSQISTSRLPITGKDLFGRDDELRRLDEAWEDDGTHVLSLVAWGGVGKSALVNYWLARMARDDYRGAARVYGWSFYSQGTTDRAVSADQFIEAALVFFGDPDPNKGSPWDKGERLARYFGSERTLLILDGLEPLQNPPGPDEGRLKDQALQSLLRGLAAHNEGLCVISTRVVVTDLAPYENSTAPRIDLDTLTPDAGAQVLRAQGATGAQADMERASEEFGGHSLALTLLGSYLSDVYGGDIARRVEVKDLEDDMTHGRHARKVMASYEKWFGDGPELAVLRILGLFNRPADKGSIDALRAAPAIPDLTEHLQNLSEPDWQRTLAKLRRATLLSASSPNHPGTIDTHPLVREHFERQLKNTSLDAWREGNNRLYEHLKNTTKEFPDTIEEMAPLYAAVTHGCAAGRHQDAYDQVYVPRIVRRKEVFSIKKLGALGAELAILAGFFDLPWRRPITTLDERARSFILSSAGFVLRAVGQLVEASQLTQAGLEAAILLTDWANAAISAGILSELYITIGNLPQALAYAEKSIELADQSEDKAQRMIRRSTLAHALYHAGRLSESEAYMRQTEEMQKDFEPDVPYLYSLRGFQYCALLLHQGRYRDVQTRAAQTLELAKEYLGRGLGLQDIALDYLSLGRSYMLQAKHEGIGDFSLALEYVNRAVNGLRQAGTLHHVPRGLMARAELHRVKDEFDRARDDLDEVMHIATRGSMGLYQADCHLEYARLGLAEGRKDEAREHWRTAKEMIGRMGYHLRDGDVREIEELLKDSEGGRGS